MKRSVMIALLCLIVMVSVCLAGCECKHDWQKATCDKPDTCMKCGAVSGEPRGHEWSDASCEEAAVCGICGEKGEGPLGHDWVEATCTAPMTCKRCKLTDGDPKSHEMLPANYHAPSTCANCEYSEGEKLVPYYVEKGLNVITAQMGVEYDYKTGTYIGKHDTVGKLWWEGYEVFSSKEGYEAVEGYEWHTVTVHIRFDDKNASKYGFIVQPALDDYYWVDSKTSPDETEPFSVNFFGVIYDQCIMQNGTGTLSEWIDGACTYTGTYAWRVPVGYDGHVIMFYHSDYSDVDVREHPETPTLFFVFTNN